MPTNDFQPFAVASGANVESQSAYLADSQFAQGVQAGVARSAIFNKAVRQATIIASVLAQFIANHSGANSTDDGTTATLLADLQTALVASLAGNFEPLLGFTPVQQGTGVGQFGNLIKLGWSAANKIKATVDTTDEGNLALENWVSTYFQPIGSYQPAGTYLSGISKSGVASASPSGSTVQTASVTFPSPFPGGCTFAIAIPLGAANSTYGYRPTSRLVSFTASGLTFEFDTLTGAAATMPVNFNQTFYYSWLALGF